MQRTCAGQLTNCHQLSLSLYLSFSLLSVSQDFLQSIGLPYDIGNDHRIGIVVAGGGTWGWLLGLVPRYHFFLRFWVEKPGNIDGFGANTLRSDFDQPA